MDDRAVPTRVVKMLEYAYLAAAAVVIIAIGVVSVMLARRGRRSEREEMFEALAAPTMAPPAVAPGSDLLLATTLQSPADMQPTAVAPVAAEPPTTEPPVSVGATGPAGHWTGDPAANQALLLMDPLAMVILDLAGGRGALTGAELRRLEVFRPERVQSAARSIELPPRLRGDEDAALRLAKIQLYAASLNARAKWGDPSARPEPAAPLSANDFKMKIARDILEMPPSDRTEVLGHMLGGLLTAPGSSSALKRSIIDTLEHLSPASLAGVLLDCLEDPDPAVQEYALVAADRLLDG